jgi:hypothetical protein
MMKKAIILTITGLLCAVSIAEGVFEDRSVTDTISGPTLLMDYRDGGPGNPVDTFMYFVPLVAPTAMDVYTDPNTTLNARIISRTSKETDGEFTTVCTFEIRGSGLYEASFEPTEMIAFNLEGNMKPRTLHNLLRSIRVDGPMQGSLEVSGTIQNAQRQVNRVQMRFDLNGKSPVTAHLYDVKSDGKACLFENRFNEQRTRIDSLSFARGGNPPRMITEVGAIAGEKQKEGFFAAVKAMLANWFLPPLPIATVGNETMINFGMALDATQPEFTFPYARNLRQSLSAMLAKKDTPPQGMQSVQ